MRVLTNFAFAGWALFFGAVSAQAEQRLALVIGNDDYSSLPKLQRAVGDATEVKAAFERLGFSVTFAKNLGFAEFAQTVAAFQSKIRPGDTVALHYSGHGVAIAGRNYLIPVDMATPNVGQELVVTKLATDAGELVEEMRGRNPNLVFAILDACRDNPFEGAGRSIGNSRGLARMEAQSGEFILFSAGPGEEALDRLGNDDRERTSVFTRVLLKHIERPGISLQSLAKATQGEVRRLAATVNHVQFPDYFDRTEDEPVLQKGTPAPDRTDYTETVFWQSIERSTKPADFEAYIAQYPNGSFAALARLRLAALEPARPAPNPAPTTPVCDGGLVASVGDAGVADAAERCLKRGDVFRDCANCPEMVVIPSGSFTMGSPRTEKDRDGDEGPQHEVTLAKPFAVGKFEVTRRQYASFVNETGYKLGDCGTQPDDHPVACVTREDAKAYATWLAVKTGRRYRLLSEAEWEYAARGQTEPGDYPRFYFGDDEADLCRYAKGVGCGKAGTIAAGLQTPNEFGLHDMLGNIWEWVEDCYQGSYAGAPNDGRAWISESCEGHVLRGGAWLVKPSNLRVADRNMPRPNYQGSDPYRDTDAGFRVARTLSPTQ